MGMDGIYIWSVSGDPVLGFEPNSISHKLNQQKIRFFTQFTKTFYLSSLLNLIIVYKAPPFTPGQGCWPMGVFCYSGQVENVVNPPMLSSSSNHISKCKALCHQYILSVYIIISIYYHQYPPANQYSPMRKTCLCLGQAEEIFGHCLRPVCCDHCECDYHQYYP